MEYFIGGTNRVVFLDDALVDEYTKYDVLRDQPFRIVIRSTYGCIPSEKEVSTKELSDLCNDVLLDELKALALLPKALVEITKREAEFRNAAKNGETKEYVL